MSDPKHEPACEVLRKEEEQLNAERTSLSGKLRDLDRQLQRVRSARRALTTRTSSPRRQNPRGLTNAEVSSLITQLRKEHPSMSLDEIAVEVTDRARREGRNLTGLHLRLAQELRQSAPEMGRSASSS